MKATVKRGSKKRVKSAKEAKRDVGKPAKPHAKRVTYPIAETLRWVADGERLLVKWGAIKSPGAKRIAATVAKILSVLEALTELRKV